MNLKVILFLLVSLFLAVLFIKLPQIDLIVSGWFYDHIQGFIFRRSVFLAFLHNATSHILSWVILNTLMLIIINTGRINKIFGLGRKEAIYILLVFAIGPGLVVNVLLKDNVGRSRPLYVEDFGGDKVFTPPFVISNECQSNCSFTAGDPSVGFAFFAFYFLAKRRKKEAFATALILGGGLGVVRILQGAHFFSDVIFCGIFVFATAYLLYHIMYGRERRL